MQVSMEGNSAENRKHESHTSRVKRCRVRSLTGRTKIQEETLVEVIRAVKYLNAGTVDHRNNKIARETERCARKALPAPSNAQACAQMLYEQLLIVQDQKQRLESDALRLPAYPFSGDMEQIFSCLKDMTDQERSIKRRLDDMGCTPLHLDSQYEAVNHVVAAMDAASLRDANERADLQARKQSLEEHLANLAVSSRPTDKPQKRVCKGFQRCGHTSASRDLPDTHATSSSFHHNAGGTVHYRLMQEAQRALQASESCLTVPLASSWMAHSHSDDSYDMSDGNGDTF